MTPVSLLSFASGYVAKVAGLNMEGRSARWPFFCTGSRRVSGGGVDRDEGISLDICQGKEIPDDGMTSASRSKRASLILRPFPAISGPISPSPSGNYAIRWYHPPLPPYPTFFRALALQLYLLCSARAYTISTMSDQQTNKSKAPSKTMVSFRPIRTSFLGVKTGNVRGKEMFYRAA